MKVTQDTFTFLTITVVIMAFSCDADRLPPPTGLSYTWKDYFNIKISWMKPTGQLGDCDIEYEILCGKDTVRNVVRTPYTTYKQLCIKEEWDSIPSNCTIRTVSKSNSKPCDREDSQSVTLSIEPQAELVKDFRCVIYPHKMKCSWIPVNPSLKLTVLYSYCEDSKQPLQSCEEYYSDGKRDGCFLRDEKNFENLQICILVKSGAGQSILKATRVLPPQQMDVTQHGEFLNLSWIPPELGQTCWTYEVCYRKCNGPPECFNTTSRFHQMPYNKRCRYEFTSRAIITHYCPYFPSESTEPVTYGTNEPPDMTLTVVAIVIPVILTVCVILSCYCFRRHRAIICPTIPDPSAIFKEMMMNGNKELKTRGNLYTPVPEPIEPCKVTLVPENSVLQQNS